MNPEQTLNVPPPAEPVSVGRLRVAEEHARSCWLRLVVHAQGGRCTCHLETGGSVHVIAGCVTGRMLYEEYWRAADLVRELSPKLEAGDFEPRDPEPQGRWYEIKEFWNAAGEGFWELRCFDCDDDIEAMRGLFPLTDDGYAEALEEGGSFVGASP